MECDYLNGWTKQGHIRKNLTQNREPQRHNWLTGEHITDWSSSDSVYELLWVTDENEILNNTWKL